VEIQLNQLLQSSFAITIWITPALLDVISDFNRTYLVTQSDNALYLPEVVEKVQLFLAQPIHSRMYAVASPARRRKRENPPNPLTPHV
jgi:hypothetical protein